MARDPKGNDRDQVMAIQGGEGDVALINTYYLGLLLNSEKPEEQAAGNSVYVIFPNQNDRGSHVNVSGAGILKNAPNKANAEKLLEFLLSEDVQRMYADANYEYPVRMGTQPSALLQSWGTFTMDSLNLSQLGAYNGRAIEIFNEAGWE
jgi:iron(III) transport system substrate-binding protein